MRISTLAIIVKTGINQRIVSHISHPITRVIISSTVASQQHLMLNLHLILVVVALGCVGTLFFDVEPYMDEVFHIPQAQQYCQGNFYHWDSKITTFPGLYLYTAALHTIIRMGGRSVCSITFLRATNLLLAAAAFVIYRACRRHIIPSKAVMDADIISTLLFVYPISAFYYFLFYTDTASVTTLCMTYYLSLSRRASTISTTKTSQQRRRQRALKQEPLEVSPATPFTAQLLLLVTSCVAVLMRQTNAVWLLFVAGTAMVDQLECEKRLRVDPHGVSIAQLLEFVIHTVRNLPRLLYATWPLLVPVGAFVIFVVVNGGVVVGDRDHHHPVYHWAMPLHFAGLHTLILAPIFVSDVLHQIVHQMGEVLTAGGRPTPSPSRQSLRPKKQESIGHLLRWLGGHLTGLTATAYVLYFHCQSHPFLLADNRHYTFYLWSRILSKPLVRLTLAPVYYISLWWSLHRWWQARGTLWLCIFILAVVLTLVPAHLLEPRYFTPAVVVAILNSPASLTDSDAKATAAVTVAVTMTATATATATATVAGPGGTKSDLNGANLGAISTPSRVYAKSFLVASIVCCCVVNAITLHVFLNRSFTWSDGSVARFLY